MAKGWVASHLGMAKHANFSTTFFFILAIIMGTIDIYHLVPLFTDLDHAWGHKVSTEQNLLASFSHTLLN